MKKTNFCQCSTPYEYNLFCGICQKEIEPAAEDRQWTPMHTRPAEDNTADNLADNLGIILLLIMLMIALGLFAYSIVTTIINLF